jgi:hypothetical protein
MGALAQWVGTCAALALIGGIAHRCAHASVSAEATVGVELEWAIDTRGWNSSKLELEITPEVRLRIGAGAQLTAIGHARADALDRLTPGKGETRSYSPLSRPLRAGDALEAELRELYVDFRVGGSDVRLGKQQVVWGEADGLKLLDVVDPQDFREFVLDGFEDSRIPLWSLNLQRPLGPVDLQLLWTPDATAHELPRRGAHFALTSPLIVGPPAPPGVPVRIRARSAPRRFLADSDVGLRLSGSWEDWELTLNYLYHYVDEPAVSRALPRAPGAPVVVDVEYVRDHLLGGTLRKAVGDWVLRGELSVSPARRFPSIRPSDRDGLVKTPESAYVLGLDWYGLAETMLSVQLFQSIVGESRDLARERVESTLTALLQKQFAHNTWSLELSAIQNLNRSDGLWRVRLTYAVRDGLRAWVGAEGFYGTREGQLGQFRGRSRIVLGSDLHF